MDRVKDLISGGALFVFALAYGLGARGLMDSGDPGVALVPIGLAAALALLSAGIALSGWRKLGHPPARDASDAGETASARDASSAGETTSARDASSAGETASATDEYGADLGAPVLSGFRQLVHRPGTARAWTVIGLTIVYAALFQILGYVVTTLLYTAAIAERFGAGRRTIALLAPCVTLITYLLFRVVLGARLPGGLIG